MQIQLYVALLIAVATIIACLTVLLGRTKIDSLGDQPATLKANLTAHNQDIAIGQLPPKVTVLVAALNEEKTIGPALKSLLNLDYPNIEIIVVNDRSTDNTTQVLSTLSQQYPQLKTLNITHLPKGWLGKSHALAQGSKIATGDYLLFTDADVLFETTALSRSITFCIAHQLDHLTIIFSLIARSNLLKALMISFGFGLLLRFKPWLASNPKSKYFFGVGGFNLVRRPVYESIGGHQSIALEILDDMMLGKLIKANGYKQQVLSGMGMVELEWYTTTKALFFGLRKNLFASMDFQKRQLFGVTVILIATRIWPWVGLLVSQGFTQALYGIVILSYFLTYTVLMRAANWRLVALVYVPVLGFFELALIWYASITVINSGGVNWRDTFYPLDELKKARKDK